MKCIELSLKKLNEECKQWAGDIEKIFSPELIIYIANAGYPIGKAMQEVFKVPMIGIEAKREGSEVKSKLGKIFSHIPSWVRNVLIYAELKSGVHKKKTERHIGWLDDYMPYQGVTKILVVDDSIDTGHTIKQVQEEIRDKFCDADIRIAGLNVWDSSKDIIGTDFELYSNTIIKAPMSKDSKEYDEYMKMIQEVRKEETH